jgi:alpha-glucosidase
MGLPPYTSSIHHDGSGRYVQKTREGECQPGDIVTLRLRASMDAPLERVFIRTSPDGEQQFIEMKLHKSQPPCNWWEANLQLTMPSVNYRFLLFSADGVWWLNGEGLHPHNPTDSADFRILAGYSAPGWVHSSVFYQIFPDRFADGDPENNVRDGEFHYWGMPAKSRGWGEPLSTGREALVEFFGGDLQGVESRLDYLAELGVNALYLNPVFTAYSNHRYDVIDYNNVDPHLGGNKALVSLSRALRERNMRLILDIVPNHCGYFHPWFQASLADPNSPEAQFFTFHQHPENYESWLGVKSLPKFNYRSQALREIMYTGPQSIFRTWLRPPYSADGWRLDVANMLARQGADQLGLEVGWGIRQAIKDENPEAYILGENFFDGTAQLQGDCWDAVMNYSGFAKPLWYWLSGFNIRQHGQPSKVESKIAWTTQAMVDTWQAFRASIPWEIACQQYNLLGSHDTERILRVVAGDPSLARLAAGILMTYMGAPGIYYGDEIGLGHDQMEAARFCMSWNRSEWDTDLLSFYQKLIHLRRTSPALLDGGFQVLATEADTLAYLRDAETEQVIVIARRGSGVRPAGPLAVAHGGIPDGSEFFEMFTGKQATVENGRLPLGQVSPGIEIWRWAV